MPEDLWQRAKPILDDALERDRKQWPTLLMETCGDDVDLFLEVSTLLAASRGLGDFIESSALDLLGMR